MRSCFFAACALFGTASAAAPTPAAWISLRREMVIGPLLVGGRRRRTKSPRVAKSNTPGGGRGCHLRFSIMTLRPAALRRGHLQLFRRLQVVLQNRQRPVEELAEVRFLARGA